MLIARLNFEVYGQRDKITPEAEKKGPFFYAEAYFLFTTWSGHYILSVSVGGGFLSAWTNLSCNFKALVLMKETQQDLCISIVPNGFH